MSAARHSRRRLSYANVASTLALILALSGGAAWAAATIGAKEIKKNAVRSKHVKNGQVKTRDLAPGAVTTEKLAGGAVDSGNLGAGAVGSREVADDSLTARDIDESSLRLGLPDLLFANVRIESPGFTPILESGNATGVTRSAVGRYKVTFNRSVPDDKCAFAASLAAGSSGVSNNGEASVGLDGSGDFGVGVFTFNPDGVLEDSQFTLVGVCE